jgi:ATP:cob(I)alamin adenosyltransferase
LLLLTLTLLQQPTNNKQMSNNTNHKCNVYTKTGDKGVTSLYNGERRPKNDLIFEALGDVDELNAHIGLAIELARKEHGDQFKMGDLLYMTQSRLLDLGSCIATPIDASRSEKYLSRVEFPESHVDYLEMWMDVADKSLPPLTNFILPGGTLYAAQLHTARTICRRAERKVVQLVRDEQVPDVVMRYLNRLSDTLFVAARFACLAYGGQESVYVKD